MQHPDGANPERFEYPIFSARLTPYRSLRPTGFRVLMGALISCWLFVCILFWSIGAWPVIGFFGLDVLLVYLAFRWNFHAANAREEISVSRSALHIRKYEPSGKLVVHEFHPFWARFKIARKPEFGITSMHVESRQDRVLIGGFLNPDDRESFANAFGEALIKARR